MTTLSENTSEDLARNENLCYTSVNTDYYSNFQAFRLYLPTFPREDIRAIIEIPWLLTRKVAIDIENYFLNSINLIMTCNAEPEKSEYILQSSRFNRFLQISTKHPLLSNAIFQVKQSISKTKRHAYILKKLKNHSGSFKVELFLDISSKLRRNLIENCKSLIDIQCCWFINVIGSMYLKHQNLFLTIIEECINLNRVIEVLHLEKEANNQKIRFEICLFMTAEFLTAVDFLHERGITHRFLCPANIYFDVRGHLKIGNLFESLDASRDMVTLIDRWHGENVDDVWFRKKFHENYLDPEVSQYLLKNQSLEAYIHMDCLADIFSIGIIVVETLSGVNFLSVNLGNDGCRSVSLPTSDTVDLYLKPEMQQILRQQLFERCGFVPKEFYAIILLMLQPKIDRMKGLRMHVQRHRYWNTSGCEYKLRLELVRRHPAFGKLDMDKIRVNPSPILQLITA